MDYSDLLDYLKNEKEEMSVNERNIAYNAGKEVDHIPYMIQAPDQAMANIFGYTTSRVDNDFDIRCEVIRKMLEEFGIDGLYVGPSLRSIGEALGSQICYPNNGFDYIKHHILNDYKDLDKLKKIDVRKSNVYIQMLETAKKLKDRFPDMAISTGLPGPISMAISIKPIESILKDTRKNPEKLHELLELSLEKSMIWIEMFTDEFGKIPCSFADPVTSMSVLSKKQYDEFSQPYIVKMVDQMVELTGAKPSAHICGITKPIWNDLADAGIQFLSIDNCEDLEDAKKILGPKIQIGGNVPPIEVMQNGTIDDVIASCKECLYKCADSPNGFILNTGCQIPIGTPRRNIEAFLYAARKYGKGAQKGKLPKGLIE